MLTDERTTVRTDAFLDGNGNPVLTIRDFTLGLNKQASWDEDAIRGTKVFDTPTYMNVNGVLAEISQRGSRRLSVCCQAVSEPAERVARRDEIRGDRECVIQILDGACAERAQQLPELGPAQLDGVEIG